MKEMTKMMKELFMIRIILIMIKIKNMKMIKYRLFLKQDKPNSSQMYNLLIAQLIIAQFNPSAVVLYALPVLPFAAHILEAASIHLTEIHLKNLKHSQQYRGTVN